ncbi:MAG: hypothetical protein ACOC2A_00480 [Halanaeroarchaeum sp.]
MGTKARLSVRTGVVGAWTAMAGFVLVIVAERLVSLVDDAAAVPPLTTAGVPIASAVTAVLVGLYNGGSVSVFVGLLLLFVGWYQVLALI